MALLFNQSVNLLKKGELVIVPTDTVYGLVCRYDFKSAVEKIYKLKRRSRRKPLILLGYNWDAVRKFVNVETCHGMSLRKCINQWPGPLTIVLPASKKTPKYINKGYKTIGIRVPKSKFLLKLLKQCPGRVLASTSANISGKSSRYPQKELIKKVKLFIKSNNKEMSFKPSKIIEIKKEKIKTIR